MLQRLTPRPAAPDLTPALLHHLGTGNDVLRTAAVRALAAQSPGDERARAALLDALVDEDPDVRSDAMEALFRFAAPEDAPAIRRSLQGDPVREVKVAAVRLLAELGDGGSVDLLRALVSSRCDDRVAWEDEDDVWDDWLDVQIAAIEALARLGVADAVQDMLAARDDEFGQTLDAPVFGALARLGSEGAAWLLAVAQTEEGLGRKRALSALATTGAEALAPHLDHILGDDMAALRALALPLLDAGDDRAAALALKDPDAGLRRAAVLRFAADRPELAIAALSDADEKVQAAALDRLQLPLEHQLHAALVDNLLAWLRSAGATLAAAAALSVARLAPNRADLALVDLADDATRPLEARIAAVEGLARLEDPHATGRLIALLANPSQQIRMVALTALRTRAAQAEAGAEAALAKAMTGRLLPATAATVAHAPEPATDLGASRMDEGPAPSVRISPDGDIIEAGAQGADAAMASTLAAIQYQPGAPEAAEETPEETAPKRRKRRAVEGPEAVADDLARVAMGIAADLPSDRIGAALMVQATAEDDMLRAAAWEAMRKRYTDAEPCGDVALAARVALRDPLPVVRAAAAQLVLSDPDPKPELRALCLRDEDALVRAIALRADSGENADALLPFLNDPARIVRDAALDRLSQGDAGGRAEAIVDALMASDHIDTLARAIGLSADLQACAAGRLLKGGLGGKQAFVLLEAFAAVRDPAASRPAG